MLSEGFLLLTFDPLTDSPFLQIDDTGTKVRANVVRSVIILREIPASTSVEVNELNHYVGLCI